MLTNTIARRGEIFQRVKAIPFPDVFKAFHSGEVRWNKTPCPFHKEKDPSFHIYEDGFFCYGCNEHGSSIDFVAKLFNLDPLAAAKLIEEKFGIHVDERPLSKQDKLNIAQEQALRQRERRLSEVFEDWCRGAQKRTRVLAEAIRNELDEHGVYVEADILPLVHKLPVFEFWADTLGQGTDDEKLELYRDQDCRRWTK